MHRLIAVVVSVVLSLFALVACGSKNVDDLKARPFDPLQDHGVYRLTQFQFGEEEVDLKDVNWEIQVFEHENATHRDPAGGEDVKFNYMATKIEVNQSGDGLKPWRAIFPGDVDSAGHMTLYLGNRLTAETGFVEGDQIKSFKQSGAIEVPFSELTDTKHRPFIDAVGRSKTIEMKGDFLVASQIGTDKFKPHKLVFERIKKASTPKLSGDYTLVDYVSHEEGKRNGIGGIATGGYFSMDASTKTAVMGIENFMAPADKILPYPTDVSAKYNLSIADISGSLDPAASTVKPKMTDKKGKDRPILNSLLGTVQTGTFSYRKIGWLIVDNKLYVEARSDGAFGFRSRYLVFEKR